MIWIRHKFWSINADEYGLAGFTFAAATAGALSVLDDNQFVFYCFAGAIAGGYAKIMSAPGGGITHAPISPPVDINWIRRRASEYLASFVHGVVFAPALIENTALAPTKANALAVAFGLAYFGNLIMDAFTPLVAKYAPLFFDFIFGRWAKWWSGDSSILKRGSAAPPPDKPHPPSPCSIFDSDHHPPKK